jgi:hypothetical protein
MRRVFGLLSAVACLCFLGAVGWLIWMQSQEVRAPSEPGVCYRQGRDGRFAVFYRDIASIETCAGVLEREHLTTGADITGAYQGRFIFIDKEAIRSADSMSGQRWRLYFDNQREVLDRKVKIPEMVMTTERAPPAANP